MNLFGVSGCFFTCPIFGQELPGLTGIDVCRDSVMERLNGYIIIWLTSDLWNTLNCLSNVQLALK